MINNKRLVDPDPRDVATFISRIMSASEYREYKVETLGAVGRDSVFFVFPEKALASPHILVAAGFHGEEPAGCWGVLDFMENGDQRFFRNCSMSFLPMVNPTGIRRGRRYNDWGENPNSGYCHNPSDSPEPSKEGRILLDHLKILKEFGRDGFLSLHEDIDCTAFYLYTFEEGDSPGDFSYCLKQAEEAFFEPMPDGDLEGGLIKEGIIFKHCDGSFEDFLFHEGIPRTACTETPGKLDFLLRIKANRKIIESFADYHILKFRS